MAASDLNRIQQFKPYLLKNRTEPNPQHHFSAGTHILGTLSSYYAENNEQAKRSTRKIIPHIRGAVVGRSNIGCISIAE